MMLERVATSVFLFLLDCLLTRLARPGRLERRAALTTVGIVVAADLAVEGAMGRLGVWRYELPGMVLGLPVDLAPDLGMVSYAYCMGLVLVGRTGRRSLLMLYPVLAAAVVGTEAWPKNRRVAREGILVFGDGIDTESALFVVENYAVIGAVLAGMTAAYYASLKLWGVRSHSLSLET